MKFDLSDIQSKEYKEFKNSHYKKHKRDDCTILFTPNGIGMGIEVYCNICKKKFDISHVEDW
jgi:hypothetical protein